MRAREKIDTITVLYQRSWKFSPEQTLPSLGSF